MAQPNALGRREAVKALLADRGDLLVITGLGSSSYDVFDAGEHPANFYLWGAMGGAAMIGLGLALAQPKRPVAVITGDGEQLMGIGSLLTIGAKKVGNLIDRRARQRPVRRDRYADQPFRPRRAARCDCDRRGPALGHRNHRT